MIFTFDSSTMCLLFLVYWAQGFKTVSALSVTFFYKSTLKLSPGTSQLVRTFTVIAWFIKPLYGISSDSFPIAGYHRRSYLFCAGFIGLISLLSMLLVDSITLAVLALLSNEFSQAIADVIADAIMVESSKKDLDKGSENLQSFTWAVVSLGGLSGGLLGGLFLEWIDPRYIIVGSGICPLLVIIASFLSNESKSSLNSQNISEKLTTIKNHCLKSENRKIILFLFLSSAISPSYSEAMYYFMNDELNIHKWAFGVISMIGYLSLFMASAGYKIFVISWSLRFTLGIGQVFLCALGMIDLALVLKLHTYLGVPAEFFVVGDNTMGTIVSFAFKSLPLMVLSAKVCPNGVEATMFAVLSSITNLGYTVSMTLGGVLLDLGGVGSGSYDYFWVLIIVQLATKLLLLPLLGLLPKEKTGDYVLFDRKELDNP